MMDRLILAIANSYLRLRYRRAAWHYKHVLGHTPNIAYPQSYNERILWRKLLDHDPQFIVFTDKLQSKEYVRRHCPTLALPRTLWVGTDANEIPNEVLSGDVFVKPNHSCGRIYPIRSGNVDRRHLKETTDEWLQSVFGIPEYSWAYSQVEPRLFVEEAIGDPEGDLVEFNIYAANGRFILGRCQGHVKKPELWRVYLGLDGTPTVGFRDQGKRVLTSLPASVNIGDSYAAAIDHSSILGGDVDYARYDFMWNGHTLYGGEVTVYPSAGLMTFADSSVHDLFMKEWALEQSHFLTANKSGFAKLYGSALKRTSRGRR